MSHHLSRRGFMVAAPLFLAGCATAQTGSPVQPARPAIPQQYLAMYAAMQDGEFALPAIDLTGVDPQYWRRVVRYYGPETPGTVVVDPERRFVYLVLEGGESMRYGCGVGRAGFGFKGDAVIQRKAQWPRWTPTPNMIRLDPERNGPFAGGVPGGPANPLGARALYLYRGGVDTLYRIHGTNEAWSIGRSVSSGCIRLFNQDIIDLYGRVPTGAKVVVLQPGSADRSGNPSAPAAV
ncbi:Lipoprotein-anchoring transpeptidase ErfK/SrfK [Aureimonas altamirensis DSM 21988]|jgi:lipoprotein-anchoring transpeptidase ErfK/SrfK|uniref:ErfK/YbiS/YcfS/YnhG family protein n=2 Tax=Aureimonas altamirensis TaxID=370622 RepID=A0A0P0YWD3_9HYPH|nr:L,D-transpeptidase [Aureimonas altamirensis]BAT25747.1 ErfK/YbiS/YcfS/YnhG family protein [Aureimonas altamirensis]SHI46572.1 Lipoprotein-anchoring transpeptidase ErfK/SrfK [Aureimonas altamirensis DSM 21988]